MCVIYMRQKKYLLFGVIIILLITISILTRSRSNCMQTQKPFYEFSNLSDISDINDLSLTIYYLNPFFITRYPISIDDLVYGITGLNEPIRERNDIHGIYDHKIIVDSYRLKEHIELIKQMSDYFLIPVEYESYIDTRIYYVFKTEECNSVLDVSMWGNNNSMFINGIEIKENKFFYDIIMPFLPEDAAFNLEAYINRDNR